MSTTTGKEARLTLTNPANGDAGLAIDVRAAEVDSTDAAWLPAHVDQRLTFTIGSDPSVSFEASDLPRHATFDPVERRFTWRPRAGQEGVWVITFTAIDPERAAPIAVRISVHASQQPLVGLR